MNKTCTSKDCPDLPDEVLSRLCEIWYPYGSKSRCMKTYENGMKSSSSAKEYREWLAENPIKVEYILEEHNKMQEEAEESE